MHPRVDKFNDKGGNGGAYSELNCGAGYKIAGYTTLISSQVFPAGIRRRNVAPPRLGRPHDLFAFYAATQLREVVLRAER